MEGRILHGREYAHDARARGSWSDAAAELHLECPGALHSFHDLDPFR